MRPTPAETVAGVRRILRDVVEPEVGSEYARARLREVRAVLAQLDADDAARTLALATRTRRSRLAEVAAWVAADPDRGPAIALPDDAPVAPPPFAVLAAAGAEVDARLVEAVDRLGAWLRAHPDDDTAHDLLARLATDLSGWPPSTARGGPAC